MSDSLKLNLSNKSIEDIDTLLEMLTKIKYKKIQSKYELGKFSEEYSEYMFPNSSASYYGSIKLTLKHLIGYFGTNKSIDEISIRHAELFLSWLKESAPKGYRVYYRNLKAAFNKDLDWGYIKENPFSKIKLRKEQCEFPTYITKGQLDQILSSTKNSIQQEIYYFAFHTGLRLNEILNLRWKNIGFSDKIITVGDDNFQTKSKAQRKVPLFNELYLRLTKLATRDKITNRNSDRFVFSKPNGFAYNPDYISKSFKGISKNLNTKQTPKS
ncbi:MAG: site-specific integrase [Bacteroidetes bacterium]|nr:site-specific integrase [Bacteroidota bacterium]